MTLSVIQGQEQCICFSLELTTAQNAETFSKLTTINLSALCVCIQASMLFTDRGGRQCALQVLDGASLRGESLRGKSGKAM